MARSYVETEFAHLYSTDRAEWRRQYNRRQRERVAAAEGRDIRHRKHDAHVRARPAPDSAPVLHDSHVRRYVQMERDRVRTRRAYWSRPEEFRASKRRAKSELRDFYVAYQLREMGVAATEITPEILELKREQILLRRLSRSLKSAARDHMKEKV